MGLEPRQTEVGDLHHPIPVDEDIEALEVTVDEDGVFAMEVVHAIRQPTSNAQFPLPAEIVLAVVVQDAE